MAGSADLIARETSRLDPRVVEELILAELVKKGDERSEPVSIGSWSE